MLLALTETILIFAPCPTSSTCRTREPRTAIPPRISRSSRGWSRLVAEVLDNAMDEAVAGHATRIELELATGDWVTVRDNGRGIPIDPHPRFPEKSALEVILTTLHSGGKFGGEAYRTSGGLHGVGVSVVNALADEFEVEVARDRRLWSQSYCR